jgi:hypothetical protein
VSIQFAKPDDVHVNAVIAFDANSLPGMVKRAASQLANATSAAEVLDARDVASVVYDAAKKAARLAKAKGAHDTLIATAHRAQADALEIEATAKRRLADEYDAAQERGEVASNGQRAAIPGENSLPTVGDIGLTSKDIHEARIIRDAEQADPGIVRRTLDEKLDAGQEPTKAALREAVTEAARQGIKGETRPSNRNPNYVDDPAYRMLLQVLGPCRSLMEKVDAGDISTDTILGAFLDADHRQRAIRDIHRARDFLTSVLETANAQ